MRLLGPVAAVLLCAGLAACGGPAAAPGGSGPAAGPVPYRVLVFTRTTGFRHASIPTGIATVRALGAEDGFAVTATEDPGAFRPAELAGYRAVVFLSTTGDVLDPAGRSALEAYVRGGGGFVGVHSASDTEYGWPFYAELVGARFAGHPPVQPVTVRFRPGAQNKTVHVEQSGRRGFLRLYTMKLRALHPAAGLWIEHRHTFVFLGCHRHERRRTHAHGRVDRARFIHSHAHVPIARHAEAGRGAGRSRLCNCQGQSQQQ